MEAFPTYDFLINTMVRISLLYQCVSVYVKPTICESHTHIVLTVVFYLTRWIPWWWWWPPPKHVRIWTKCMRTSELLSVWCKLLEALKKYCNKMKGINNMWSLTCTWFPICQHVTYALFIQSVSWLVDITAGGDFLGLCNQKSSNKHVSDFGRLRSYDRLKLRIEGND